MICTCGSKNITQAGRPKPFPIICEDCNKTFAYHSHYIEGHESLIAQKAYSLIEMLGYPDQVLLSLRPKREDFIQIRVAVISQDGTEDVFVEGTYGYFDKEEYPVNGQGEIYSLMEMVKDILHEDHFVEVALKEEDVIRHLQ